jgi:hypothetical protein
MNDYAKGAFECLSWLEAKLADLEERKDSWGLLKREVSDAIHDIRRGVGVDFRERLRATL